MTQFIFSRFRQFVFVCAFSTFVFNCFAHESCQITVLNGNYFVAKLELPYVPQGRFLLHYAEKKQLFLAYRITHLNNHIVSLEITSPSEILTSRPVLISENSSVDAEFNNFFFHIDCTGKENRIGPSHEFSIRKRNGGKTSVEAQPLFGFLMNGLTVQNISQSEPEADSIALGLSHDEENKEEHPFLKEDQEGLGKDEKTNETCELLFQDNRNDQSMRADSPSVASTQSSSDQSTGSSGTLKRQRFDAKVDQIFEKWFQKHSDFPYASEDQKLRLLRKTGLSTLKQVSDKLTNYRKRVLRAEMGKKKRARYIADMKAERKRRSASKRED